MVNADAENTFGTFHLLAFALHVATAFFDVKNRQQRASHTQTRGHTRK